VLRILTEAVPSSFSDGACGVSVMQDHIGIISGASSPWALSSHAQDPVSAAVAVGVAG
jgi:hypothetical protein